MTAISVDPRLRARRSAVASASQRRRLKRLIGLSVLVAVALGAWGVTRSPLLDVDEVRWSGLDGTDLARASAIASIKTGAPIASVDGGSIESRLRELPWIEDVVVNRNWSGVIDIDVIERVPVAVVMKTQDEWVMVDQSGVVLTDVVVGSELPKLSGVPAAGDPGSTVDASVGAPLVVARLVGPELRPRLEGIARDERGEMWITLTSADRILLGDDSQLSLKVVAATTVIEALDAEGRIGWEMDVSVPTLPIVRDLRPEWQQPEISE
ncbi:MAG: FtsQ-type POTRA domain-containing protein [Actinobacteria bacterium]|nr:FtsQ-type POTRA domain-containing protein [Actinomycetota bacterium]